MEINIGYGVLSVVGMQFANGKLETSFCDIFNIDDLQVVAKLARQYIYKVVKRAHFHTKSDFSRVESNF